MGISRSTAFITVALLIALIALFSIGIVNSVGTAVTHGPNTEHTSGTIMSMNTDGSFVLKTATGALTHFQCNERCVTAQSHMQRHINEHAHTDVYYMRTADGTMIAVDVD
ncbi:hypothetical protein [Dictyobacter arantiisoli]|uniref:Uncharacterized protein n=1 Tax=Dictyobacter arantiisoli TaxID=2014874 RepID=A0A5A5TGZ7_9CHLR|nr:hypothetical protein [Dictyobacter arantiisoli]GCF10426.1 hypothetical protein KDI_39900 [Dictyobacter arantiisoli]